MAQDRLETATLRPAGYLALIETLGLEVIPNWHQSYVASQGSHRIDTSGEAVEEVYPASYWPGESLGDHLEFALKYDGTNLSILATFFEAVEQNEILAYVNSKPTGRYARRVWFLYEFFTGDTLPLEDLRQGNYIDLIDSESYYTIAPGQRAQRQRIRNNLLGVRGFCPTVRRSEILREYEGANLAERCRGVLASYPPELLKRALSYLYTKETKSSFQIEHEAPSTRRTERFVALLQMAERRDFCAKDPLIELQNRIVDPRFQDTDYRSTQNYVGETIAWQREKIHFVGPKPEDLPELVEGLIEAHERMQEGDVHAVVHAAVVAFGFVFLHPFEDGNGRIHRFLIHNVLARLSFTPEGIMFPVSAAMLKHSTDYDASLEAFSKSLMPMVEYSLDEDGRMTVHNETRTCYAFMDMTAQAEALFRFVEQTIDSELPEELAFLVNFDEAKRAIQSVADLPDRQIDLFIRFCLQNHGRLAERKRASHFAFLSDEEIASMEAAIQGIYGNDSPDFTPRN